MLSHSLSIRWLLAFTLVAFLAGCGRKQENRPVEPEKLIALIKQADRIVVLDSPQKDAEILFSSNEPKDIAEFSDALTVNVPKHEFHCACIGTEAILLYRGETILTSITNHHGQSVRCSLWKSDAKIKDQEKWLAWFDARKIPEPRQEVEEANVRAEESAIAYRRWQAAMPKSIQPIWEKSRTQWGDPDPKPLGVALAKEFPEVRSRALALFAWYGSGEGPWSGFPAYETAAEKLLLGFPTADLVAAAQTENLTTAQTEGAARLLGGWSFWKLRPDDSKKLPAALKAKLLEHALKSTDEFKQNRAKYAFDP